MNKIELEKLGFKLIDEICTTYEMDLGNIKLEWSIAPCQGSINLVLPDGTRVVTNAKDENDIIQLGLMFKDVIIETNAELFTP